MPQLPIAPFVAIATLDIEKVFKKSQKLNAAMAPIKPRRQPVYSPSVKID